MTVDTKKLRELAEAATPGPWRMETGVYQDPDGDDDVAFARGPMCTREPGQKWDGLWRQRAERNARYIEAANPQTVIALLDDLEMARAKADVIGGDACLEERAAGNGPCGACAVCCQELREQLAAANAEIERLRGKENTAVSRTHVLADTLDAIRSQLSAANAEIDRLRAKDEAAGDGYVELHRIATERLQNMARDRDDLREQLAAMTAERDVLAAAVKHGAALYREMTKARDEACKTLHDIGSHDDEYGYAVDVAAELQKVGQ